MRGTFSHRPTLKDSAEMATLSCLWFQDRDLSTRSHQSLALSNHLDQVDEPISLSAISQSLVASRSIKPIYTPHYIFILE